MFDVRESAASRIRRWPEDYAAERAFYLAQLRSVRSRWAYTVSPGLQDAATLYRNCLVGLRIGRAS